MVAIYALFWVMSAFFVLPFGVRTAEEAGAERVPGQAESAPHDFRPSRIVKRATVVSAVLFVLFYANYVEGWITPGMLDFTR
jgi:predicted secreted protein